MTLIKKKLRLSLNTKTARKRSGCRKTLSDRQLHRLPDIVQIVAEVFIFMLHHIVRQTDPAMLTDFGNLVERRFLVPLLRLMLGFSFDADGTASNAVDAHGTDAGIVLICL